MANQTASIAIFYLSLYIMFTEFTKGKDSVKDYKIKLGLQQNCAICEEIMKSFFFVRGQESHYGPCDLTLAVKKYARKPAPPEMPDNKNRQKNE